MADASRHPLCAAEAPCVDPRRSLRRSDAADVLRAVSRRDAHSGRLGGCAIKAAPKLPAANGTDVVVDLGLVAHSHLHARRCCPRAFKDFDANGGDVLRLMLSKMI